MRILLILLASGFVTVMCIRLMSMAGRGDAVRELRSPMFVEWPSGESLPLGDITSLPAINSDSRLADRLSGRDYLAVFTVAPGTCSQRFNEIHEFHGLLEAESEAFLPVLLVASDDSDGVEWFLESRDLSMATLYAPSPTLLRELRRFRGSEIYDQMIILDTVGGSVLLRVPLNTAVTPAENKKELLSMIEDRA